MAYLDRDNTQPDRRSDYAFTLYVSDLPEELNKDGIAQIFQSFGEIQIISPGGAQWAFVSYKTYGEAEHAIRALNDRGPLYLKVAFQRKKPQKAPKHNEPTNASPIQDHLVKDFRYSDNRIVSNGNSRNFMPGMVGSNLPRFASYNNELDVNSVYPIDLDHNMYDPFETPGRYGDTTAMWSRGCVNVDGFGKRHVSMGRGFTRYQIPEPHPNLEERIGAVYEKRRAGLYEYGEDRLQSGIGKCQKCMRVSNLRCEQCCGFYCSRECQLGDWPRHKMECRRIVPDLIVVPDEMSISRSSSDDQMLQIPRKPGGMDLRTVGPLRRPKVAKTLDAKHSQENEIAKKSPMISGDELLGKASFDDNAIVPKSAVPEIGVSQPVRHPNSLQRVDHNRPIRNGSSTSPGKTYENHNEPTNPLKENRRHDENFNDRSKSNAMPPNGFGHSQNVSRNDRDKENSKIDNNRSLDASDNFRSSGIGQNVGAIAKQGRNNSVQTEGILDRAKLEFSKMDDDLAFRREPRDLPNIGNKTPIAISSIEHLEMITGGKPIDSLISKTDFTSVTVTHAMDDDTFWVHRHVDFKTVYQMVEELQTKTPRYPIVQKIVIGEIYAVKCDDLWYRIIVTSKDPTTIFYGDFGNHETVRSDCEFRSITDFPKYPLYAIRMRLAVGSTPRKIADDVELSVRMIKLDDDGVIEVETKDEEKKTTTNDHSETKEILSKAPEVEATPPRPKASTVSNSEVVKNSNTIAEPKKIDEKLVVKLPSTVDSLEKSSSGYLQVWMALDNDSYAVCVLNSDLVGKYEMVYEKLTEFCNAAIQPTNFNPKIGDFVCGKRNDSWLRGYVYSIEPSIRLALVDEARISIVERVMPMPEEFSKICSFGSICTFASPGFTFDVDEPAEFVVEGFETLGDEKIVNATLIVPERLKNVRVTLKNWTPTYEQQGLPFSDLKNNSKVYITAYRNERTMYVHSLDDESVERRGIVTQKVAKWAQKAPKLNGPPVIGQLVIAKFDDGNFYRALVAKIQDEKIGVSYVDYGNRAFTTIDDLRVLSDELKNERSCTAKIVLKDIATDVPPTQEVHRYLNRLVGDEVTLLCTFDGIPSEDGVTLTTSGGECVNNKVNEYLTPSWKREDPAKDTKCFTMMELEYAKLGEVGKTANVLVLYASDVPFKYAMCPCDQEHLTHVTSTMPEMIDEYCKSTKDHYIPRASELCLAVFEGIWYRGICLNPSSTPTQATINFIDFGNTDEVDHVNIRQMTKDFMTPAALACLCEVKNLGIELVNGEIPVRIKERLDALIKVNEFMDVKITKKLDEGDYEVELPQVRAQLVKEGLAK